MAGRSVARGLIAGLLTLVSLSAMAADVQVSTYDWDPEPIPNGATATFSIVVASSGGSVSDAKLAVDVSSKFEVDPGNIPAGCALSGAAGAQTLNCDLPTLESGGSYTFSYSATAVALGSANTTATISSATAADINTANDSLTVTPAVQAGADLTVTQADNLPDDTIAAGGVITYTLTANNAGPDATAAIKLTDNLPAASDFEYQNATGTNWSCAHSGTQVICTYTGPAITGALPPVSISGKVVRQTTGTITNGAFVTLTDSLVVEPNPGNNAAASLTTNIIAGSDMRVSKDMPAIIVRGTDATVTLGIYNDGPQTISGATITDTIVSNFTLGTMPARWQMATAGFSRFR
ncbi:DUF11 domain-containing protein [Pedomonas mirosovicensis]|uniref:DUF11 domain-containing protein n=1 Tax=Pedomonas mirosovicensis TaxID=2908641 RepID=UPI00216A3B94|nr:DUF11 domain-containing protein [Pedomonas mirosovicensis]MCH8686212.1 DUF11 domain-containing protein [Pedomonas mirosovicensis]